MLEILYKTFKCVSSLFLREGGFSFFKLKLEGLYKTRSKISMACCVFFFSLESKAQCAMCRAVLESEEGQSTAEGVNDGIMYLMSIPYILVAGFAVLIYWNFFRRKKEAN